MHTSDDPYETDQNVRSIQFLSIHYIHMKAI